MLPVRIGLISQSNSVDFPSLVRVASAINVQVTRDVSPVWGVVGTVSAIESAQDLVPGVWPVYIVDELDDSMAGFHLTDHGQPYAMVKAGNTWSLGVSHEVIEMMIDPSGNRLVASSAVAIIDNEVQDGVGKFEYLVEACDPSEDPSCAYLIDGVLVSDFYTPNYFDPADTQGARYSFSGRISRPRQVLPNGYLSWYNAVTNTLQQVRHFGAPVIVDIATGRPGGGSLTGGRTLRSFVDSVTHPPQMLSQLPSSVAKVEQRDLRRTFLASVGSERARMFSAAATGTASAFASLAATQSAGAAQDALAIVRAKIELFSKPGVLSVRPGLRLSLQSSAAERVIVATVLPERLSELLAAIPAQIEGVRVDLRPASAMQVVQARQPAQYLMMAAARHELRQPDFDGQVFFNEDGTVAANPAPLAAFAAARAGKPHIAYEAPAGASLNAVSGQSRLCCTSVQTQGGVNCPSSLPE